MVIVRSLFIITGFLLIPSLGWSQDSVDLSEAWRCDMIINQNCTDAGGDFSQVRDTMKQNVGITVNTGKLAAPMPVGINVQLTPAARKRVAEVAPPSKRAPAGPDADSSSVKPGGEAETTKSSTTGTGAANGFGLGGFGNGDSGGSADGFDLGTSGAGGSPTKPMMVNGVPYVNHDEDSPKIDTNIEKSGGSGIGSPTMTAAELNRKNSELGSNDGSSRGRTPASSAGAGLLGGSGGGTGKGGRAKGAGQSLIAAIAERLKDGVNSFMGLGGDGGSKGLDSNGNPLPGAKGKGANPRMLANGRDPKDILRANFDKYKRGLANRLEFGDSNSFLFQSMCQHYIDYAKANRIPNNAGPCPMN